MEANAQAMVSDRVVTAEPVSFLSPILILDQQADNSVLTDVRNLQFGNVA